MRILWLAHYYPPEIGGGAVRFHGLARWLARFGHQVTVITGMPNYPSGNVLPEYRGKLWLQESLDGVNVLRVWVYASAYKSRWRRLANYLSYIPSAVLRGLIARQRFDVLVAGSPPPFVGVAGVILAWALGIPWVLDIGDLWPEVAIEAGELAPASVLAWAGNHMMRFLYRAASHLTPATETKRRRLVELGMPASKVTVIEAGADLEPSMTSDVSDWRDKLGLQGRFLIVYAGLIGIAQGVETIADVAHVLRNNPMIHFLIVGEGVRRDRVVKRVQDLALTNVTLLPPQPYEAMPAMLRAADVVWVPLATSRLVDAVPSKLLEAWGQEKPVILSAEGEAERLVAEVQGGLRTPPGDVQSLAEAILKLQGSPDLRRESARRGYEFVQQRFRRDMLAKRMEEVLLGVMRGSEAP
ncbi:MAG: glycosyltransferase family 4 protein [Anaerolineae bacterium]|nr:glycosyltransferase family 4 protein [Anaerolineae bacterium]